MKHDPDTDVDYLIQIAELDLEAAYAARRNADLAVAAAETRVIVAGRYLDALKRKREETQFFPPEVFT
jgi:hypothetical protein